MTPANPIYKQDQDEILDLDRAQETATNDARGRAERRLQDKLKTDLQRTGDVEARLNGELQRQIMNATSAGPKLQRATEVAADIQRLDIRETAVDDTLRALRMQQTGPGQVRISLVATPPASPEPNRNKLLLLAALPLALLFGATAAVLARKQDPKLYGPLDVDDVLGFPPLAVLPARGDVSQRVFEEYVLRLAAGVESAYRTSGARTFLLTAVSLTTDIRPLTSALARKFEDIGMSVAVATASEMLAPTESVPNVDDHQTQHELARTVELWREGFVAANITRLKTEHGLVLIEAEALLNCGQTEYVARCADATILMIESGTTTREELYRAAELLERLNVTGIGAVLEELRLRFADGAFRAAVAAVDRRQADVRPMQPRTVAQPIVRPVQRAVTQPVPVVVPVQVAEVVAAPKVEEVIQAPIQPPVVTPIEQPVIPVHAVETIVARAAIAEVAHEHTPEAVAAEWVKHEVAEVAGRPVLVEHEVPQVESVEENFVEEPLIALANGTTHEKMASTLSGRRQVSEVVGDATMNAKASWLDRLLRRDAGSDFRIVPMTTTRMRTEVARTSAPVNVKKPVASGDEYDLPLANRLEQISRIRPALQGTAFNSGTRGSRLQIVPQELPPEVVVPQMTGLPQTLQGALPGTIETHEVPVVHAIEAVLPIEEVMHEAPVEHAVESVESTLQALV